MQVDTPTERVVQISCHKRSRFLDCLFDHQRSISQVEVGEPLLLTNITHAETENFYVEVQAAREVGAIEFRHNLLVNH
jgi:hypothetical protein